VALVNHAITHCQRLKKGSGGHKDIDVAFVELAVLIWRELKREPSNVPKDWRDIISSPPPTFQSIYKTNTILHHSSLQRSI
jgi:hypothetical protein